MNAGIMRPDRPEIQILFIHHSTGRGLIEQGEMRSLLAARTAHEDSRYALWDHDYNEIGLSNPSGVRMNMAFPIPEDNTDPDGLDRIFGQPVHISPDNALSHMLSYDVVLFKSCFPVSHITSDAQLDRYKEHYRSIRKILLKYPHVLFIVISPPPLAPNALPFMLKGGTNQAAAKRARAFARWLSSQEFLGGLRNAVVFDLFDQLALPDDRAKDANTLRPAFRSPRGIRKIDSHPNTSAYKHVAPRLVDFLIQSIQNYRQSWDYGKVS